MCVLISLNAQYLTKDTSQPRTNILMLLQLPVRAKLLFCSDRLASFSFQKLFYLLLIEVADTSVIQTTLKLLL